MRKRGYATSHGPNDTDVNTLKVHHGGGLFEDEGIMSYVDGEVSPIDDVVGSFLAYTDMEDIAMLLGYERKLDFYYKVLGNNEFILIESNQDVEILDQYGHSKVINLYFYVRPMPFKLHLEPCADEFVFGPNNKVPFDIGPTPIYHEGEENPIPKPQIPVLEPHSNPIVEEIVVEINDDTNLEGSEFEDSDQEESYMPKNDVDHTKNWQGFHDIHLEEDTNYLLESED